MKCTRLVCLMAVAVLLMAPGQVTATPVSESFDTFIKRAYLNPADTTWHGFHLTNGVCDLLKAYGGSGWSVRLRYGTIPPTPYMEYVGADSLGKDGGVGTISFAWRNWNENAAEIEYKVYAQINGGAYDSIGILNSTDTTWYTFSYNLNTSSDNVRIKILKTLLSGERLMIDNFEISDNTTGDVTPPSISSITVTDSTHLEVFFSEPVSLTTAETEGNYVVTPGSTNPSLATRDGTNIALVHLTFASALPTGVGTLTVNAVQDISSNHNACTNATKLWSEGPPPPPESGRITGTVRGTDGTVLDSVAVALSPGTRRDTTNSQGVFLIDSLSPGQYLLAVTRAAHIEKDTVVSVAAGSVTTVNMTLQGEVTVVVTVRRESGQPIGGAYVRSIGPTPLEVATNDSGLCTLRVVEGTYQIAASAAGFMDRQTPPEFWQGASRATVTVVMSEHQEQTPIYVFTIRGVDPFGSSTPDDGGSLWDALRLRISLRLGSISVTSVTINPTGGFASNHESISQQIDAVMQHAPIHSRLILVGHSMGGILARYYVAHGSRNVDRIFTIDSPHYGSPLAALDEANFNRCFYKFSFRRCWHRPHPAYWQLSPAGMLSQNRDLLPLERTKSTRYFVISSQTSSINPLADYVVPLSSQQGKPGGISMFSDFESRVTRRDPPFTCEDIPDCPCTVFDLHSCTPSAGAICDYVVDNLNTVSSEIATPQRASDVFFDTQYSSVLTRVFNLQSGILRLDTLPIPQTPSCCVTTLGLDRPSVWQLQSPDSIVFDDSSDFATIGGTFVTDSVNRLLMAHFPTSVSGNWVLNLLYDGPDSLDVVLSVSAPIPVCLQPVMMQAVSLPGNPALLSASASAVEGVTVDSVVASFLGDSVRVRLHDDGLVGDVAAGDSAWSGLTDTLLESGAYSVELVAYAHAGTEQYRVQSSLVIQVEQPVAQLVNSVTWQPVDADSNGLFERLSAAVPVMVDSSARLALAATLVGPNGEFITATQTEDSFTMTPPPGGWWLVLSFDGKHVADARVNGPFVLKDVRLDRIGSGGSVTIAYQESLAVSPVYSYSVFEGRPIEVENVGAVRMETEIEVFWTPHLDPDIEFFKIYYDTDGEEPYNGMGLNEGNSPINAGSSLTFHLTGADSAQSFTIAVTAVDSSGSESNYSLPYTVFALAPPDPVHDLTITTDGLDYILAWTPVPGGACYWVESATAPDGPWTPIAQTYSTSLRRSADPANTKMFFRVIARR